MTTSDSDVVFQTLEGRKGSIGLITLNRPERLNALNQSMCIAIHAQLTIWAEIDAIKAVVIRGAGERAFCAGGDIRALYQSRDGDHEIGRQFFRHEYGVNRHIYHFPKPYIALLDGLTMGGGMGLSINGKYRVGTPRLTLAMPETGIGFFPDVGGSHFLPRCRGKIGCYLGLTGSTIDVADAYYAGLVTSVTPSENISGLLDALVMAEWEGNGQHIVEQVLQSWAIEPPKPSLAAHQAVIDRCFSQPSIERVLAALEQESSAWALETVKVLRSRSPTSLKVVLEEL